jgi:cytochrome c nitrite reductase small subunit
MANASASKRTRYLVVLGTAAAAIMVFVLFGPPQVLARSETPTFCAGCHTMESQYEAWFHTGAHRRKNCVDCHLPNDNLALHYVWKSIDGVKDVVFQYSGLSSEHQKLSAHGNTVVQGNCVRCHGSAVELIDTDRKCWDCHRRLMHRRSGAIETN